MGVLATDATDRRRDLADRLLKPSWYFHRLSGTRVEDGRELTAQHPVLLSPKFQGKEAIMSAKH